MSAENDGFRTRDLGSTNAEHRGDDYLAVGDVIDGQYTVLGVLGSGGMGTVYRARDERLRRDVAVKLIHDDMLRRPRMRQAFVDEARAMAQLRHPNVVTVYAFGEHEERPYLVMERIEGASLALRIRDAVPPALVEAIAILDALCQGVHAIHEAGALHGDLKPGNVMLEREGRVAVTDFGLSRALHQVGRREPRFAFGTPGYLAPELAREDVLEPELAKGIDIYALGVIAFELLTGRAPFEVRSVAGLLHEHAYGDVPRPSTVRAGLPVGFDAPLMRALAKAPADRTPSVDELRRAVLAAARSITDVAQPLGILCVDDEPGALFAVRELLLTAFPHARVTTVTNTQTAVAIAVRERPDVIVTDLHMPDGGALELTTVLRAQESTREIPIVVVTGMGGAQDWHELRGLGADRFLVKPIDFDSLVAIIRSLVERAKAKRELEGK